MGTQVATEAFKASIVDSSAGNYEVRIMTVLGRPDDGEYNPIAPVRSADLAICGFTS